MSRNGQSAAKPTCHTKIVQEEGSETIIEWGVALIRGNLLRDSPYPPEQGVCVNREFSLPRGTESNDPEHKYSGEDGVIGQQPR